MTNQHLVTCAAAGCRSHLAWTDLDDDIAPDRLASHGWDLGHDEVWYCPRHTAAEPGSGARSAAGPGGQGSVWPAAAASVVGPVPAATHRPVGSQPAGGADTGGLPGRRRVGRAGRRLRRGGRWPASLAMVAVAAVVVVGGCATTRASTPAPAGSLTAPATSGGSADPAAEVRAAVAAYTGLLDAFTAASNAGTDDPTGLARYATGGALQMLTDGLTTNRANGLHTQGAPGIDPPRVVAIAPVDNPTAVTLTGCVDDTGWQLYTGTGQVADRGASGRRGTSARIDKSDVGWRVAALAIKGVGTCSG